MQFVKQAFILTVVSLAQGQLLLNSLYPGLANKLLALQDPTAAVAEELLANKVAAHPQAVDNVLTNKMTPVAVASQGRFMGSSSVSL